MKTRAQVKNIMNINGSTLITIQTEQKPEHFEKLMNKDCDFEIAVHREKRSLDANAYYHVLCGKIANAIGSSMTQVCNKMIADYGQRDYLIDGIGMRDYIDYTKIEKIHLRPTTETYYKDGALMRKYEVMRGSHTYNTKEMSDLIHGVVSEAEELGIPTMTSKEEARLLEMWSNR